MNRSNRTYTSPVLIAPGYSNSGPQHWQTIWQHESPEFVRVEQGSWIQPNAEDWIANIERKVAAAGPESVIVAHSLACIATALWAQQTTLKVKGVLFVAPADSESENFTLPVYGFEKIPSTPLPFKSILIGSTNDPYCSYERAKQLAENWNSSLINLGDKGHINAESDLDNWEEGRDYLDQLLAE